jgi:hypothetical protein
MSNVPYFQSPHKNACALACHFMVAKTFFPETSIDELKSLLRWQDGKVVWAFPFWLWLIEKGLTVLDYDTVPYEAWAKGGFRALEGKVSENSYEYWREYTHAPQLYCAELAKLFANEHFRYVQRTPELEDLINALEQGYLCEVVLNPRVLNDNSGFSLHRVVVLEVNKTHVVFHDPGNPGDAPRQERTETLEHFMHAWSPEVRELCVYAKHESRSNG